MKKEMKWGLATLLLLLGIAAVFLFIDKDTETEPEMTLGQPTKDLLKKGVKLPQQTPQVVDVSDDTQRPPPPGETHQTPIIANDVPTTDPVSTQAKAADGIVTADEIPSAEELARIRDFDMAQKPQEIEKLKTSVAQSEKLYDLWFTLTQKFPDDDGARKILAERKRILAQQKLELSSAQKYMEVYHGYK